MLQLMKPLSKGKIFIIAIGVTIGILYLSLIKTPKATIQFHHLDKLQHALAYFILTISWLFAFYGKNKKRIIICSCIFYGILIEILQETLTEYRTGDSLDIIANSTGVLLGLLLFNQLFKKIEVKKQKDL